MKKVVFMLALVALVIGSVYAGSVIAAPKSAAGPVVMQAYAGDLMTLTDTEEHDLLRLSFPQLTHISVTAPAGTLNIYNYLADHGFCQVKADMDGDGFNETNIAPLGETASYWGYEFGACYEFDAYGFNVEAWPNYSELPWECRANATVTWVK